MTKKTTNDRLSQRKLLYVTIGPGSRPSHPGPSLSSPVVKKLRLYTNRYMNIYKTERPETDQPIKLSSPLRLIKPNLDRCSYAVDARFCVFECRSEEKSFSGPIVKISYDRDVVRKEVIHHYVVRTLYAVGVYCRPSTSSNQLISWIHI